MADGSVDALSVREKRTHGVKRRGLEGSDGRRFPVPTLRGPDAERRRRAVRLRRLRFSASPGGADPRPQRLREESTSDRDEHRRRGIHGVGRRCAIGRHLCSAPRVCSPAVMCTSRRTSCRSTLGGRMPTGAGGRGGRPSGVHPHRPRTDLPVLPPPAPGRRLSRPTDTLPDSVRPPSTTPRCGSPRRSRWRSRRDRAVLLLLWEDRSVEQTAAILRGRPGAVRNESVRRARQDPGPSGPRPVRARQPADPGAAAPTSPSSPTPETR